MIACQIEGEFHPPVTGPISERVGRSPQTPEGWRKFRFDVKARVNIEPGLDGAPRFRIEIDEVKKRELEGFSGVVARFLGQYFDELVTQLASGRASRLNKRLNDEIKKRVTLFKEYGVFRAIDYSPSEVVLHFDVTRFRSEGIAGYVFADEQPGTVPLYRWLHPRDGSHYYTIRPNAPDRPNSVSEGISCHVYDHPVAETVPLLPMAERRDDLYTTSPMARMPAGPATGRWASPATSIAIPNRGPCRSTASLTQSGTSTSTRCTRMPSSRSRLCADRTASRSHRPHAVRSPRSPARLDHPGDLFVGRVTGTTEPDQALVGHAQPLDDGHRVEVAVRGEDPPGGEQPADLFGGPAGEREGERGRPRSTRRRPEKLDAFDLAQSVPEPFKSAEPRS